MVTLGGIGLQASGLGELGFGRDNCVFILRGRGLDPGREPSSKRLVVEGERAAHQGGQNGHVVVVDAGGELVELLQQRSRLRTLALREVELRDGGEGERDEPG